MLKSLMRVVTLAFLLSSRPYPFFAVVFVLYTHTFHSLDFPFLKASPLPYPILMINR